MPIHFTYCNLAGTVHPIAGWYAPCLVSWSVPRGTPQGYLLGPHIFSLRRRIRQWVLLLYLDGWWRQQFSQELDYMATDQPNALTVWQHCFSVLLFTIDSQAVTYGFQRPSYRTLAVAGTVRSNSRWWSGNADAEIISIGTGSSTNSKKSKHVAEAKTLVARGDGNYEFRMKFKWCHIS